MQAGKAELHHGDFSTHIKCFRGPSSDSQHLWRDSLSPNFLITGSRCQNERAKLGAKKTCSDMLWKTHYNTHIPGHGEFPFAHAILFSIYIVSRPPRMRHRYHPQWVSTPVRECVNVRSLYCVFIHATLPSRPSLRAPNTLYTWACALFAVSVVCLSIKLFPWARAQPNRRGQKETTPTKNKNFSRTSTPCVLVAFDFDFFGLIKFVNRKKLVGTKNFAWSTNNYFSINKFDQPKKVKITDR